MTGPLLKFRILCAWCGKEKMDANEWRMNYAPSLRDKRDKCVLSHGICPICATAFLEQSNLGQQTSKKILEP
jgi:hypothetical protein